MTSDFCQAARVNTPGCNRTERAQILRAVSWLKSHLNQIADRMGTDGLSPFEGRSKARLSKRLRRGHLSFACTKRKDCHKNVHTIKIADWAVPVQHRYPLELCTAKLANEGQYLVVIAHELGHQVWINADRKDCLKRCDQPRLSQSLATVVYHLWHGSRYDRSLCLAACEPRMMPSAPSILSLIHI